MSCRCPYTASKMPQNSYFMRKKLNSLNGTKKGFCPVRGKNLSFSRIAVKSTTGQNSAAHARETSGVTGEGGPGRGSESPYFALQVLSGCSAPGPLAVLRNPALCRVLPDERCQVSMEPVWKSV